MYPFLHKVNNKRYLKLHSGLYKNSLLKEVEKREPGYIKSIRLDKNYYLIDLNINKPEEYFNFLDCLIYLERSK